MGSYFLGIKFTSVPISYVEGMKKLVTIPADRIGYGHQMMVAIQAEEFSCEDTQFSWKPARMLDIKEI